jgi:hypothetical protein
MIGGEHMPMHIASTTFGALLGAALLVAGAQALAQAPVVIADGGRSDYSIYLAKDAPPSVAEAAAELQRVIAVATGAKLPIVNEPAPAMICLGDNPETRRLGVDPAALPDEHFVIETRGRHLVIAGKDTRADQRTAQGGVSEGTYLGALEFLERCVGVRWLFPDTLGEDIPSLKQLTVAPLAVRDGPDFAHRALHSVGGRPEAKAWQRRMRVDAGRSAMRLSYNHAFHLYGMKDALKGRPELMALIDGKRRPVEDCKNDYLSEMKFCTSNPELVRLYADALLKAMDANPAQTMWAISPSDGAGWCQCPTCAATDEPCDWPGAGGNKSLSPRVFDFYNAVARIVREKQPDKRLGCFAYAAYNYPPLKAMEFEPNLFLMAASRPYYGYSLYHPVLSDEFNRLVDSWDERFHGRMGWFDFSVYVGPLRCSVGAPYPPGFPIMKQIFPKVKQKGWKAMFWAGLQVNGYGALSNYVAAKLCWRADADVDALAAEWLRRAYGPGGEPMGALYALLEKQLADYKRSFKVADGQLYQYRCVPDQVRAVHLPIFPQMESLYREALAKAATDAQRQRLEMFGDNLVILHWHLRKAGWLKTPETSLFHRTDEDFRAFAQKNYLSPSVRCVWKTPEEMLVPKLGETPVPVKRQE